MTSTTQETRRDQGTQDTQVYRIYIKVAPEKVWQALTDPDWTDRYGYTGRVEYDLRPGGAFRQVAGPAMEAAGFSGPMADGEVVEADPPHRLVQTWRMVMDPAVEAEGSRRLTYDLRAIGDGTRLTVTHELTDAPLTSAMVAGAGEEQDAGAGGGWAWVLSDLKSLLETGTTLAGR